MLASFPTLKRGANNRCASGAMEIGTRLVFGRVILFVAIE